MVTIKCLVLDELSHGQIVDRKCSSDMLHIPAVGAGVTVAGVCPGAVEGVGAGDGAGGGVGGGAGGAGGGLVIRTSVMSQKPALFFWSVTNCPLMGESSQVRSWFVTDPEGVVPHSSLIVIG